MRENLHKRKIGSFNRYMVECELRVKVARQSARKCFNRYMVECEFVKTSDLSSVIQVLIDTWWNVNFDKANS